MEEKVKDLLLLYRNLGTEAHAALDEIITITQALCFQITYTNEHGSEKTFFLNRHSKSMLRDFLLNPHENEHGNSEYMKDYCIGKIYNLRVSQFVRTRSTEGSYFPYYNASEFNLSRYQIYKKDEERVERHCLLYALEQLGVDVKKINNYTDNTYVKMTDLSALSKKLEINIDLHVLGKNDRKHINRYPKKNRFASTVELALYKDHYFVYELVAGTNSLLLIHRLFESESFRPLSYTEEWHAPVQVPPSDCLQEQREYELKEKKKVADFSISFADTECITRPYHKAFLYARYYTYQGQCNYKVYQESENFAGFRSFLNSFTHSHNIVYFHNLKYDWFVLKSCPFINIRSIVVKDGQYYKVVFVYAKKIYELRDSYKLVPKKLANFTEMFNLEQVQKQSYILYNLYSEENAFLLEKDYVAYVDYTDQPYQYAYEVTREGYTKVDKVKEASILIDERIVVSKKIFDYCANYFLNGRYYHLPHCRHYILYDCLLLKQGLEKFRQCMLDLLAIDCFEELTLASMVHRRAVELGSYKGVYACEDNLRAFLAQAVQGGRVCFKDNVLWKCKGIIKPIDAKSMYASAIRRICREGGFPIGPAKPITGWNPVSHFYYVVKIRILSIKKKQQLPFVSFLDEQGGRHYANQTDNLVVVVDKITLEDWVKFQDIEYEFLEGVYWDEGGNAEMGSFIEQVYATRKDYVEQGNISMSEVCKLVLNSLYGKTIIRPNISKTIIKDNDKADDYISKNFERLVSMEKCGRQSLITLVNSELGHANMNHVGGMILSMAKRIINEVLDLATDLNIHVLYHDTDSLHVVDTLDDNYQNKLEELVLAYKEQYKKDLIGNELEQFGYDLKYPGHENVYSSQCIILGKKAYIHRVTGTKDGEKEHYDLPRISGINSAALSEYPDKWDLYQRMYDGEKIVFDLAYGDGVVFNFREVITTRESFKKVVSYKGERRVL